MTNDDIIRMANEAWGEPVGKPWAETTLIPLARFAALVAAAERQKLQHELLTLEKWKGMALAKDGDGRTVQEIQREAREAEREKFCSDLRGLHDVYSLQSVSTIRAKGQT